MVAFAAKLVFKKKPLSFLSKRKPMSEFQFGGNVVWRPSEEIVAESRLKNFMDSYGIANVEELQRRSTEDIEWFWAAVLRELGIEFYQPYERILDTSRGIAWPRWCCDGK